MSRKSVFVVMCALCAFLLFQPAASHAKRGMPEYVVEKSYGQSNTGPSMLIAFATNYGSTYKIAEVIAEVLSAEADGFKVDVRFAKNITQSDLAGYDAVILGSCIYIEKWHKEALAFLEQHQAALSAIPLAYFCVNGLMGMTFDGVEELMDEHYLQPMYGLYGLTPKDVTGFAGAVDYRILKPIDWLLLHLMFMPRGNWTDYAAVVSWAYEVSDKLK